MKTAVKIDRNVLNSAIQKAEANGPLPNRSVLYDSVLAHYQSLSPDPKVTASVIMLRITKENISVLTPKGKRGRQKGVKIGNVVRTKRADKISKEHIAALRASFPPNYQNIVDKIAKGSVKAMCKGMCLSCVGFERMVKEDNDAASKAVDQIGQCTIISCPIYSIRPYQKG